jgi:hypothetical protein
MPLISLKNNFTEPHTETRSGFLSEPRCPRLEDNHPADVHQRYVKRMGVPGLHIYIFAIG